MAGMLVQQTRFALATPGNYLICPFYLISSVVGLFSHFPERRSLASILTTCYLFFNRLSHSKAHFLPVSFPRSFQTWSNSYTIPTSSAPRVGRAENDSLSLFAYWAPLPPSHFPLLLFFPANEGGAGKEEDRKKEEEEEVTIYAMSLPRVARSS